MSKTQVRTKSSFRFMLAVPASQHSSTGFKLVINASKFNHNSVAFLACITVTPFILFGRSKKKRREREMRCRAARGGSRRDKEQAAAWNVQGRVACRVQGRRG
ncbi:hypothetical protein M758_4G225900 [Ceratodon purpureus]|nr:hypothetical protein M758_4G225900 [Ceratodon purpureus]